MNLRVVPELYCSNVTLSASFFIDVLGFQVEYERPEEGFYYLNRDGVSLMLEGIMPSNRQWFTGKLEVPFGRGINFEWEVKDLDILYQNVKALAPEAIYLSLESRVYITADKQVMQDQFIVQVPDGYLFRFCQG